VGYFESASSDQASRDFVYAGKVGTGFDTRLLLELRARLEPLEIERPPFTKAVGLPRLRAHWVKPEIVVQVAFIEWTVNGKLRHPRLLGVRIDKTAGEVERETPSESGTDETPGPQSKTNRAENTRKAKP
jgi:ATP-dependent DNA ligase